MSLSYIPYIQSGSLESVESQTQPLPLSVCNRLEDMKKHLQENFQNKLDEFSDKANSFEGWLTKEEKKFQAMGVVAPNLEAAMKQKPKIEVHHVSFCLDTYIEVI